MAKNNKISESEFKKAVAEVREYIADSYCGIGLFSKYGEEKWFAVWVRDEMARNPDKVVKAARVNFDIQRALRKELADRIEAQLAIPAEVLGWLVEVLRDHAALMPSSGKKPKHGILDFVIWEALRRLEQRGLKPTRSPSTKPQHSGSDAVAAALSDLGLPSASFDAVVGIYKRYRRKEKNAGAIRTLEER